MRGVILDRDGTLIDFYRDPDVGVVTPAFHPDHVRILPGVIAGLRLFKDAGYSLSIATNQPDAAKGRLPMAAVDRTNARLLEVLDDAGVAIDRFERCPHHPEGGPGGDPALIGPCDCRKPKPGMLNRIVEGLQLDRSTTWMIGDTAADLGAADAAGVRAALVIQTERCELCQLRGLPCPTEPALRGASLDIIAHQILDSSATLS